MDVLYNALEVGFQLHDASVYERTPGIAHAFPMSPPLTVAVAMLVGTSTCL